jgi:hypothetical protein
MTVFKRFFWREWRLPLVISTTWEMEIRKCSVGGQPRQKVSETPS